MKLYTISSGSVSEGIEVTTFEFSKQTVKIPAITVGEEGRGSSLGVLPVNLTGASYKEWKEKGSVRISFATLGKTKSGNAKLLQTDKDETPENFCAAFRTKIGFRGGNNHKGDKNESFPGTTICSGRISQGAAGGMGSGEQLISIMPYETVFSTHYSGRLYGADSAHFYFHDKQNLLSATEKERDVSDIF